MRILLVSSEVEPLASTGKIGREVTGLAKELIALGHDVSVVMPCYRQARDAARLKRTGVQFPVAVGTSTCRCEILETRIGNLQVFLTRRDEFFDRSGLYGSADGDYQDNAARFLFFSKSAVELARRMEPRPDVLHANGWQSAMAAVYARESQTGIPVVLSPRGLQFQGNFWSYDFGLTNLPPSYFSARGIEFFGSMNFLKGGILFSDAVVLPGEIAVGACQTSAHGQGLEQVLRENAAKLSGIPEGDALDGWEAPPANTNPAIGWDQPGDGKDIVVMSGSSSAGLEHLFASLQHIVHFGARVTLLGPCAETAHIALEVARRRFPSSFRYHEEFDSSTARPLLSQSDFILFPGAPDPFSPWLERAMICGTIPVVRQCEGITQLVTPRHGNDGNGFVFWNDGGEALTDQLLSAFQLPAEERHAMKSECLSRPFTRTRSAEAHARLYARIAH